MRFLVVSIIVILFSVTATGQAKKRDKVKRKYRKVESVQIQTEPIFFRGKVRDADGNLLVGVHAHIPGLRKSVHTNGAGEYFFYKLPESKMRIYFSLMGYQNKYIDYVLKPGQNFHNITLDEDKAHFLPEITEYQNHEEHVQDVPYGSYVADADLFEKTAIVNVTELSDFLCGTFFSETGSINPLYVFRGIGSCGFSPGIFPRLAAKTDGVPVDPAFLPFEPFDMEKIIVNNGLQTGGGSYAEMGEIRYYSNSIKQDFGGYLTTGGGSFLRKEVVGAVNIPILKDKLYARTAGFYTNTDGYIKDNSGINLNGGRNTAGKVSLRFIPKYNMKLDLLVNYQKETKNGAGFILENISVPAVAEKDFFYQSNLSSPENLGSEKQLFSTILKYRYAQNEHFYWTTTSAYVKNSGKNNWDADGSVQPILNFKNEKADTRFYQDIRFNYSLFSRLNGAIGVDLVWAKRTQNLFFAGDGLQNGLFETGSLYELRSDILKDKTGGAYLNTSLQFLRRAVLFGGIRANYSWLKLSNGQSVNSGNSAFIFTPRETVEGKQKAFNINWNTGLQYFFTDNINLFIRYSTGQRNPVLHYNLAGELQEPEPEKLTTYEAGTKFSFWRRIFVSAIGFYQQFENLQQPVLKAGANFSEVTFDLQHFGNATIKGVEVKMKSEILKGLSVFGNYTFLKTSVSNGGTDSTNISRTLPYAPKHAVAAGIGTSVMITDNIRLFLSPWFTYKTDFRMGQVNSEGIEQSAYGTLNAKAGIELVKPALLLDLYAKNILNEKYIAAIGNDGNLLGIKTFLPGTPRFFGAKLTWKFVAVQKPYYKRKRK